MADLHNVSRREFLAALGLTGGGLVLGFSATHAASEVALHTRRGLRGSLTPEPW